MIWEEKERKKAGEWEVKPQEPQNQAIQKSKRKVEKKTKKKKRIAAALEKDPAQS